MNNSFYIGATGLRAQQSALDIVSNNLANLNTNAYKRSSVVFAEMVSPPQSAGTAETIPSGKTTGLTSTSGLGVSVVDLPKILTAGDYKKTDGSMDIAIRGAGFVELLGQNGETLLWRGGTLKISRDGLLTAAQGAPVKGVGPLPARTEQLRIDEQGRVFALVAGASANRQIGQIELASALNASALEAQGDGIFKVQEQQTELVRARPGEHGLGSIAQGYIEGSNVNITEEMVSLLWIQRSYGANARVIQAADELMGMTNSLKR